MGAWAQLLGVGLGLEPLTGTEVGRSWVWGFRAGRQACVKGGYRARYVRPLCII